jgi:hypothetical protein
LFAGDSLNGIKIHPDTKFVPVTLKPLGGSTIQSLLVISQSDDQVACMELEEVVILVLQGSDQ